MPTREYDLIIVGAGPAGCSAALNLAGSSLKVAVVDKADLPADKVCGDALSGTALAVLRRFPGNCFDAFLALEPKKPSWGIRFAAPSGELLDVPFVLERTAATPPPGYLCKRKIFDGFLQQKAMEVASFPVLSNYPIHQIRKENEFYLVQGEKEEIRCRMILGADGVHSIVGKLLAGHSQNNKQYCLGVRTYFTGVRNLHPEGFIELHFLEELLPGYLWIFPMADGIANVGLGMLFEKMKSMPESLSEVFLNIIKTNPTISGRFQAAVMTGKIEAHGLPLGPDNKTVSGEGFLLAGDAAALVDPFTGEGIGNAMVSGEIAASMILEAFQKNDFSARFLRQYDERIHERFWREMKTSHRIQELCTHPALFNLVVKKANRNKELKEMFTKMYTNQDALEQLKSPGFYLRTLFG